MKNLVHIISKKLPDKLLNAINTSLDNVIATGSGSISEFISKSTTNKYYPKRVLLLSNSVGSLTNLEDLYFYLKENSENTEVVLICNYTEEKGLEDFETVEHYKNTFQEPVYSVRYSDTKWAIKAFIGVVVETSTELEERSRLFENEYSLIFGQPKENTRLAEKAENSPAPEEVPDENIAVEDSFNSTFTYVPEESNLESLEEGVTVGESENNEFPNGTETVETQTEKTNECVNNTTGETGSNIFNLGGFGGQHVETGFLGIGEDEIVEDNTSKEGYQETTPPVYKESKEVVETFATPVPERKSILDPVVNKKKGIDFNSADGVVEVVTGTRDVDTSNYIIQESLKYLDNGMKVLIVDFDFLYNNILSNIDLYRFQNSQTQGVGVYEEDGLYFLSGGYGKNAKDALSEILPLIKRVESNEIYNKIFIDLPMDVFSSVEVKSLGDITVNLLVRGDYQSFIRTYVAAEEIPFEIALSYFYNGKATIQKGNIDWQDDLIEFKKVVVPGKVDWLNNAYLGE